MSVVFLFVWGFFFFCCYCLVGGVRFFSFYTVISLSPTCPSLLVLSLTLFQCAASYGQLHVQFVVMLFVKAESVHGMHLSV